MPDSEHLFAWRQPLPRVGRTQPTTLPRNFHRVTPRKANPLRWFLLFLLGSAVFQLPAQQTEADRKLLADIRAKAEKGDAFCQYDLGRALEQGWLGVAKDEAQAVKWYRKAAEQNLAEAQFGLGFCYENGEGVAKDAVEGVKWYRKAAEQNYALAQNNLGLCYDNGEGVAKDEAEAVKWYRKAAEQNHARAQYNLGVCYAHGQGVAKDDVEAVKWFRKAAEQNHAQAQYNLGLCYAIGKGVAKDYVEAYKWTLLAASQGDESARQNATILENRMSRQQIAEGHKLARNFKPQEVGWSHSG